ncbi:MAG: hypothetical protein K0R75_4006, partial [Paenibacillaceae bacterium]|nr:hypothetical protein [Paenibacillaceae bacterium]
IAQVMDNYQRILNFPVNLHGLRTLRLEGLEMNGLDHARVVEIVCE